MVRRTLAVAAPWVVALAIAVVAGCGAPPRNLRATSLAPWHDGQGQAADSAPDFRNTPSLARRQAERTLASLPPWKRGAQVALRQALAASYIARGLSMFDRGAYQAAAQDLQRARALGQPATASAAASLQWRLALRAGNHPVDARFTEASAALKSLDVAVLPPAARAMAQTWRLMLEGQTQDVDAVAVLLAWLADERYMRLGYRLVTRSPATAAALAKLPQATRFLAWYRGDADTAAAGVCAVPTPFADRSDAWAPWVAAAPIGEGLARSLCDRSIDDGACAYAVGRALLGAGQLHRAARWFAQAQAIDEGMQHAPSLAPTVARAYVEAAMGHLDVAEQWLLVAETEAREPGVVSASLAAAAAPATKAEALFLRWTQRLAPALLQPALPRSLPRVINMTSCQ